MPYDCLIGSVAYGLRPRPYKSLNWFRVPAFPLGCYDFLSYNGLINAPVMELVDIRNLKFRASRRAGASPVGSINNNT
jgi:hypothetical protein